MSEAEAALLDKLMFGDVYQGAEETRERRREQPMPLALAVGAVQVGCVHVCMYEQRISSARVHQMVCAARAHAMSAGVR